MKTKMNCSWEDFYQNALVLGLDIGVKGIGIWLRKGQQCLWAGTLVAPLPEAAPLRNRRLLRAARRSRASRRHREALLKAFCSKYHLPWVEIGDNPFHLRYKALKSKNGLADKEELVKCLRHIIRHRGYDYHLMRSTEGDYPWGAELNFKDACAWVKTTCCSPALAAEIRADVEDASWSDEKKQEFSKLLDEATQRYNAEPILSRLEEHFQKKPHERPPARKINFPRELIEDQMEKICRRHAHFFKDNATLEKAIGELKKILNYHRKEPGALAHRRVKDCPYLPRLQPGQNAKCSTNADENVRRFKLLEFLATRTFVLKNEERLVANEQLYKSLNDILNKDIEALKNKTQRPNLRNLRNDFGKVIGQKLAPNNASHNKHYFTQLRDLLRPKPAKLKKRASMSSQAVALLLQKALPNGFQPSAIVKNLQDFYNWRRDVESGYGLYPQVELLLGRYSQKARKWVTKGWLQRLLERKEIRETIGDKAVPDYVVIECVGDIPRNTTEAKDIQKEQQQRRKFKEELCKRYKLPDHASDVEIKKVLLFDQQGGRCPYTGKSLGHPLNPDLQIDHIFPRTRGGISEMVNLVLTHAATNLKKGDRTPMECQGDFTQMREHIKSMKWNKTKRDLFLRTETEVPDWQNLTRVAQLARHLRQEIARWLGLLDNPNEIARRIGTPSGYLTGVCRESWQHKLPEKDRRNLRHHLWDAAVLSHIPPGPGMNLIQYGGIFYYRNELAGPRLYAKKEYAPDVLGFEKEHQDDCLVFQIRRSHTKQSRYEQTIYRLDDQGRLWVRTPIIGSDGKAITKLEVLLEQAGLMSGPKTMISRKQLENWLTDPSRPLYLRNNSRIEAVRVKVNQESPLSLIPHRNRQGQIMGFKKSKETYLRLEIWEGPEKDKKGRPQYYKRFIPHPRHMKNFAKRGFHFRRPPKNMPDELKRQVIGLMGAFGKVITPELPLRRQICGELPPFAKKVGFFAKGDLFHIPFDANGDIDLVSEKPFCKLWYRVRSIRSDSVVNLALAEFLDCNATPLKNAKLDRSEINPSDTATLAYLVTHCKKNGPSSHSDQREP